jgi:hypothetical protein
VPIEPTGAVQVVVAVGLPYGRASGGGCGGRGARLRLSGMQPARSWHFVFARRVGLEVPLVRRHSLLSLQARQLPLGVRLPFVITSGAPPPSAFEKSAGLGDIQSRLPGDRARSYGRYKIGYFPEISAGVGCDGEASRQ